MLHYISTSPQQDNALSCALRYAAAGDSFLLAGDSVNALLQPSWRSALAPFTVQLMADDVIARGLSSWLTAYPQLDYSQFVALTLTCDKVISW